MNSKQKRKHRRLFPYYISSHKFKNRWKIHDDIVSWCNDQFGKENYRIEWGDWYKESIIGFKEEAHLTLFMLRWSERV